MKKRNIIGAAVMAGLILAAMPLGASRSLGELREDAQGEYYYDDAGYAIWEGMDKRREAANNLVTVAKRYVGKEQWLDPYIDELEYRVRASENVYEGGSAKEVSANQEMGAAAEQLADALEKVELAERDQKYPAQMIAQMQSEQDKIERSSYNDTARQFNGRLHAFPVNLLRPFTGVEELAVFDGAGAIAGTADVREAISAEDGGKQEAVAEGRAETTVEMP